MFQTNIHDPRILKWQSRLARVPRWGWIAFIVGAVIPVLALFIFLISAALFTGMLVLIAVMLVGTVLSLVSRVLHRRRGVHSLDDGRRNVKIVVSSSRIIDP